MDDMRLKMKSKIIDELLSELEDQEGESMKPKAMGVEVTEIKPEESGSPDITAEMNADKGENEDELKALMHHYISKKL